MIVYLGNYSFKPDMRLVWHDHNTISYVVLFLFLLFFSPVSSLIPEKQARGWKEFLVKGLPIHQSSNVQTPGFEICTPLDPVEQKKQDILNDLDYEEYTVSLTRFKKLIK